MTTVMHRRARRGGVVLASAALLAVAGCGGGSSGVGSLPPKQELTKSISNLGNNEALTVRMHVEGDQDAVRQLVTQAGESGSAIAKFVSTAKVEYVVQSPGSKKLSDYQAGGNSEPDMDLIVTSSGRTAVELRQLSGTLYAKMDPVTLAPLLGSESPLKSLESAGASIKWLKDFFDGRWISVDALQASVLKQQLGGAASQNSKDKGYAAQVRQVLDKDVTVTRTKSGDNDTLTISADAGKLIPDLVAAVPGGQLLQQQLGSRSIPSKRLTATATVAGDTLSEVDFDLGQLADKPTVKPVKLITEIKEKGAPISAPNDAERADLSQLSGVLGNLGSGKA